MEYYVGLDQLENPADSVDGYLDVLDFPSGGNYREGSDVLDRMIQLEKVQAPTKGKQFLDSVIAGGIKLPRANPGDFRESMPGSQIPGGRGWYNEDNPGRYDQEIPDPFGTDLFPRAAVPASLGYVG